MSVLNLKITTARSAAELTQRYESGVGPKSVVESLSRYILGVSTGNELAVPSGSVGINISIQENATQASGTLTLTSVIATDAVVINGSTFTCVASGATAAQFNLGADDTETAANLAASINAAASAVYGIVVATSAATVVTVKAATYGVAGNGITLVSSDGTIVASVARLASGANDPTAVTLNF